MIISNSVARQAQASSDPSDFTLHVKNEEEQSELSFNRLSIHWELWLTRRTPRYARNEEGGNKLTHQASGPPKSWETRQTRASSMAMAGVWRGKPVDVTEGGGPCEWEKEGRRLEARARVSETHCCRPWGCVTGVQWPGNAISRRPSHATFHLPRTQALLSASSTSHSSSRRFGQCNFFRGRFGQRPPNSTLLPFATDSR